MNMTDGNIVKIARKMAKLQDQLFALLDEVEYSGHPNAKQLAEALREECIFLAWPTHVIHTHLEKPDAWETETSGETLATSLGIKHKAASAAAAAQIIGSGSWSRPDRHDE